MNLRVLIVEDEPRLRELLSEALRGWDFAPIETASGERALHFMQDADADILLLDLNLPGMNGIDTLRQMREQQIDAPAIILTGFGDLNQARHAIELGVVAFLTKPCRLGELEQALDRARKQLIPALPVLKPEKSTSSEPAIKLHDVERQHILALLDQYNGNRTATAKALGISRRTLQYRLAEYGKAEIDQ